MPRDNDSPSLKEVADGGLVGKLSNSLQTTCLLGAAAVTSSHALSPQFLQKQEGQMTRRRILQSIDYVHALVLSIEYVYAYIHIYININTYIYIHIHIYYI